MSQNIYDDETLFAGYSRLQRSIHGLDGAPEWPALRGLLPDVQALKVLDLGCGYGWFCRWAAEHGAADVLGVDVSERMLQRAAGWKAHPGITYRRADLESIALPERAFDLIYSSLALHYIENLRGLLTSVHHALLPGARFVFSIEHPVLMAPRRQRFCKDAEGRSFWPLDGYQNEGRRVTHWLAEGVIKQHRTMGTLVNMLIDSGLTLSRMIEWGPSEEQVRSMPALAEEVERPMFLMISAQKSALCRADCYE
ncbi:class I SAM-dependent methyltransferase [Caballeronia sp. LZ065]|uniref:class I SAM-dependent methyltransferase n=1 Tax=Caballeronia sp. LZ065 TaxID=3038571 RepID=UPI0028605CD7|nr:class I SAM-dependent methyltransferase [Caballeronia sp. LZ065]MDR5780597.1 class I SAM-dependent methyltransferase [Caballeronia sp. LZ065]